MNRMSALTERTGLGRLLDGTSTWVHIAPALATPAGRIICGAGPTLAIPIQAAAPDVPRVARIPQSKSRFEAKRRAALRRQRRSHGLTGQTR